MSRAPHTFERVHHGPGASPADTVTERGITLGAWTVTARHGSIANAAELDRLGADLGIPPPEMPFPRNALTLTHASGFVYRFDAESALRCVGGVCDAYRLEGVDCAAHCRALATGVSLGDARAQRAPGGVIKVAYASEWGSSRDVRGAIERPGGAGASNFSTDALPSTISSGREYDWTYSSTWAGSATVRGAPCTAFAPGTDPARDRIPVERLGPSDAPILFYDELVLYEDELGDNGSSMLTVKVRVMPEELLVLQRFFLRVDNVVFRVFDTRIYVSFRAADADAGPHARLVRECRGAEAPYSALRARLPAHRPDDLLPLTDVNWVAAQLQALHPRADAPGAPLGWEGVGAYVDVAHVS